MTIHRVAPFFQLHIALDEIRPQIWRRVLVPSKVDFEYLHLVLNAAMGWNNSHLHDFTIGERRIGMNLEDEGLPKDTEDEKKVCIDDVLRPGLRFRYAYDFGDTWMHTVLVEEKVPFNDRLMAPRCIGGRNACPPDDCGGVWGYAEMLEALANPRNKLGRERAEWIGGFWDPKGFDANRVNRDLRELGL